MRFSRCTLLADMPLIYSLLIQRSVTYYTRVGCRSLFGCSDVEEEAQASQGAPTADRAARGAVPHFDGKGPRHRQTLRAVGRPVRCRRRGALPAQIAAR